MVDCRKCKHNYKPSTCEPKCNRMCDGESDFEPVTNAMRIRSMTDEELAEFLYGTDHYVDDSECIVCFSETRLHDGKEDILEWLQSEAE